MCRTEEVQDCCSEIEYDELEFHLCELETAYVHIDHGLSVTSKDQSIISNLPT